MEFFIQQLINGLTLGGIYALIALGYTMVYGIIQLINFAHGEFFAAGGYMGVILLSFLAARGYLETHPWLCLGGAMVLAMIYCAFLAMAVEKVAYTRLRFSSRLSALVSALGMSIFLSNGLMLTQGVYDKAYPSSFAQGGFDFGMVTISYLQIIIFLVTAALLVLLNILVFKTRIGKAMRATAQDKVMSSLVGISSSKIISLTFALGAGLAAAAGIIMGLYYGSVNSTPSKSASSALASPFRKSRTKRPISSLVFRHVRGMSFGDCSISSYRLDHLPPKPFGIGRGDGLREFGPGHPVDAHRPPDSANSFPWAQYLAPRFFAITSTSTQNRLHSLSSMATRMNGNRSANMITGGRGHKPIGPNLKIPMSPDWKVEHGAT